jgi:hypothetical protein
VNPYMDCHATPDFPLCAGPVDQHHDTVTESDQEIHMRNQPEPPGEEPRKANAAEIHDRRHATDGGEQSMVGIAERRCDLAGQSCLDDSGHMIAHLLGSRRDARYRALG